MAFPVAVEAFLVDSVLLLIHCAQQCFQLFTVVVLVIVFFAIIVVTCIFFMAFHNSNADA